MKKYFKYIIVLSTAVAVFISCKKDTASDISYASPSSFNQAFNEFWNDMNVNYIYWDIDTTNWDAMYSRYQPVFAGLNINDSNDLKKSVGYFRQMTDGLIDSHYTLSFLASPITDSFVEPSLDRKLRSPNFHYPYSYISLDSLFYIDKGYVDGTYTSSSNETIFALSGTIDHKILYFNCNLFGLEEASLSATNNGVKNALQYFFSNTENLPTNIKAIIIDVRGNHGGDLNDLNFLIGHLISNPLHFGFTRYKSGNGRLDYTPWVDADITPAQNVNIPSVPVIVLADNFSISLAEAVTMAIHTMPNGTFVGETTWGATGPLTENGIYNDGQFTISNFLFTYTSSAEFKYINGEIYEGKGFPPDVSVPFDSTALKQGDDPMLDKAISLVQ